MLNGRSDSGNVRAASQDYLSWTHANACTTLLHGKDSIKPTCCFKLVKAQADEPSACRLSGFGGGSADSKRHIAGKAAGAFNKASNEAGQVKAATLGAFLEALSWACQEGPHSQAQVMKDA